HCPECGRSFDPEDLRSMNMGRPMRWLARALVAPIRPMRLSVTIICLMFLWGGAWLAFGFYFYTIAIGWTIGLVSLQCARVLIRRCIALRYHWRIEKNPGLFLWPLLLSLALSSTNIPRKTMLWLHRPMLDRFAHHVYAEIPARQLRPISVRLGLYY